MGVSQITAGMIIVLVWMFILVSPQIVTTQNAELVRNTMMFYTVFFLFAVVLFAGGKSLITQISTPSMALFLGSFFVTAFFVKIVPQAFASSLEIVSLPLTALGIVAGGVYVFIKALAEELIFRDLLENLLGRYASLVLFGLFHFGVLLISGISLAAVTVSMLLLMMLGLAWSLMKEAGKGVEGLMIAAGSHTAWNFYALGLLAYFM